MADRYETIATAIGAMALGANIIEVHAIFEKEMFGHDSNSSLTIQEIRQMVESVRFIEEA